MAGMFWFRQGPSRNAVIVGHPESATYIYVRSAGMEIDNLEAGRELDALVAEKVMGWTLGKPHLLHGYLMHGSVEIECWEGSLKDNVTQTKDSWHPSTDIRWAWEVVEKLKRYGFELGYQFDESGELEWDASFDMERHSEAHCVYAPTAPLAICKAALKAVGV